MRIFGRHSQFWRLIVPVILLSWACGCQFFGGGEIGPGFQGTDPTSGPADVRMVIIVPGQGTVSGNRVPLVEGVQGGAQVTFRLILVNVGNPDRPTTSLSKTVTLSAGETSVTVSFQAVPAQTVIGEAEFAGCSISGQTVFHGAVDLVAGVNDLPIAPMGSGLAPDITAKVVRMVAETPDLIRSAKPQLATFVKTAQGQVATASFPNFYQEVLEKFVNDPVALDQNSVLILKKSPDETTLIATGSARWEKTPVQILGGKVGVPSGLLVAGILRHGLSRDPIVAWQTADRSGFALTRLEPGTGNLVSYLTGSGGGFRFQDQAVVLSDGAVIIGGVLNGQPVVFRWDGQTDSVADRSLTGGGIVWYRLLSGFPQSETLACRFLEYDGSSGKPRIICQFSAPDAQLMKLFAFDPESGADTTLSITGPEFPLWAQTGSGSALLGWVPPDGVHRFTLYWEKGLTLATATAPRLENASLPSLLTGLENGASYTFMVTGHATAGEVIARSRQVTAAPVADDSPLVFQSYQLASGTIEVGGLSGLGIRFVQSNEMSERFEVTGPNPIKPGSILVGYENGGYMKRVVEFATQPGPNGTTYVDCRTASASITDVFSEGRFVFEGPASQLNARSVAGLSVRDPNYSRKMSFLSRGTGPRPRISPEVSFANGLITFDLEKFDFNPKITMNYEVSWGTLTQFEFRVDGPTSIRTKMTVKIAPDEEQGQFPLVEKTLWPKDEIPFLIGPVPCTWAKEAKLTMGYEVQGEIDIVQTWDATLNCNIGANYLNETGWDGQAFARLDRSSSWDLNLKGSFSSGAQVELGTSFKMGGVFGPTLKLSPNLTSKLGYNTAKPWLLEAQLETGASGKLGLVLEPWGYKLASYDKGFNLLGPYTLASQTLDMNSTPTVSILSGPAEVANTVVDEGRGARIVSTYPSLIKVLATDTGIFAGVEKVRVCLDDPEKVMYEIGWTEPPEGLAPLQGRLPPGPHTLYFFALDKAGATSPVAIHSVSGVSVFPSTATSRWSGSGPIKEEFQYSTAESDFSPDPYYAGMEWALKWPALNRTVPLKNGAYRSFHSNGKLAAKGEFTRSFRSGDWEFHLWSGELETAFKATYSSSGQDLGKLTGLKVWRNIYDGSGVLQFASLTRELKPTGDGQCLIDLQIEDILMSMNYQILATTAWSYTANPPSAGNVDPAFEAGEIILGKKNGSWTEQLHSKSKWEGYYASGVRTGWWYLKGTDTPENASSWVPIQDLLYDGSGGILETVDYYYSGGLTLWSSKRRTLADGSYETWQKSIGGMYYRRFSAAGVLLEGPTWIPD